MDTLLFFVMVIQKRAPAMQTEAILAHKALYSVSLFRQKVKWLPQWVKFNL